MPSRRRHCWTSSLALAAVLAGAPSPAAAAAPPTSVVSMGDSYIAGEGGRWLGNSANVAGDRDGTDRACVFLLRTCTSYDLGRVYVDGTAATGCHRADVAEVMSARLPVDRRVNLACSGAGTANLRRASQGGTPYHGEASQADRLLAVAQSTRVRMIVVSIGGNDLDFGDLVRECFTGYLTRLSKCSRTQTARLSDDKLAETATKVAGAIDEIRAAMGIAGYAKRDYRLVLQTYPVVLPRAADSRHREADLGHTLDGCPFFDADMTWTKDVAAVRIGSMVRQAAAARAVELLDLRRAFEGHEICARTAAAATPLRRPSAIDAEWGRAVSASAIAQGQLEEVFHPNAHGHRALGRCLGLLYASRRGSYACSGAAGHAPRDMVLKPLRPSIKRLPR